jgi:hypothetical protein
MIKPWDLGASSSQDDDNYGSDIFDVWSRAGAPTSTKF